MFLRGGKGVSRVGLLCATPRERGRMHRVGDADRVRVEPENEVELSTPSRVTPRQRWVQLRAYVVGRRRSVSLVRGWSFVESTSWRAQVATRLLSAANPPGRIVSPLDLLDAGEPLRHLVTQAHLMGSAEGGSFTRLTYKAVATEFRARVAARRWLISLQGNLRAWLVIFLGYFVAFLPQPGLVHATLIVFVILTVAMDTFFWTQYAWQALHLERLAMLFRFIEHAPQLDGDSALHAKLCPSAPNRRGVSYLLLIINALNAASSVLLFSLALSGVAVAAIAAVVLSIFAILIMAYEWLHNRWKHSHARQLVALRQSDSGGSPWKAPPSFSPSAEDKTVHLVGSTADISLDIHAISCYAWFATYAGYMLLIGPVGRFLSGPNLGAQPPGFAFARQITPLRSPTEALTAHPPFHPKASAHVCMHSRARSVGQLRIVQQCAAAHFRCLWRSPLPLLHAALRDGRSPA